MILTDLLQAIRDVVKQGQASAPDAELLRQADMVIASLARKQVESNQGYYNCELNLAESDFHQTASDEWDAQLPSWVLRVVDLKERTPGADPAVQSPWESGSEDRWTQRVRRSVQSNAYSGWEQVGDLLRLRGASQGANLVLRAAKLPARMFKATLDVKQTEADGLVLPAAMTLGTHEIEGGRYIGSRIMCSLSSTASMGSYMICTASETHKKTSGSTLATKLTLARPTPANLVVGDVIESMMPLDAVHARLVSLRTALTVFQRDGNRKGIAAIGDDLSNEMSEFQSFIQPRQNQTPSFAKRTVGNEWPREEPDRYRRR